MKMLSKALSIIMKGLLRRRESMLAIIALALPVSILAAAVSLSLYVGVGERLLEEWGERGRLYAIWGKWSGDWSRLESSLKRLSCVRSIAYENILWVRVEGWGEASLVSTDNASSLVSMLGGRVTGRLPRRAGEAAVGSLIASGGNLSIGSALRISHGGVAENYRVTGIIYSNSQLDASIIVLGRGGDGFRLILLQASGDGGVRRVLPKGVRMEALGDPWRFALSIEGEVRRSLDYWMIAAYLVVAASSYAISARLVAEAEDDVRLLRRLGASGGLILASLASYMLILSLAAGMLGVALGVVGSQVTSTAAWWAGLGRLISPYLDIPEALRIMLFTAASSLMGGFYPAYRASRLEG